MELVILSAFNWELRVIFLLLNSCAGNSSLVLTERILAAEGISFVVVVGAVFEVYFGVAINSRLLLLALTS